MPRMIDLISGSVKHDIRDRPEEEKCPEVKDKNYLSISKNILSAMRKRETEELKKTGILYEKIVQSTLQLLEKIRKKEDAAACLQDLYVIFDELFSQLVTGESILEEMYETRKGYYLPYHISNMLVLSSFLGIKIGFNKSKLRNLGLAAIFCDIGLDQCRDTISKPLKLNKDELELVKKHVWNSVDIVSKIPHIDKDVKDAVLMHHERVDGSGYPDGLRAGEISDYAKIIGLVDTYDALTNNRVYREGENAHKTVKLLLGSLKESFDYNTMRSFLNAISLYPIGTLVELNTGETARVIGVDPGSPLKPIVLIVQDFSGNLVKEKKIINLAATHSVSIVNSR